MMNFSNSDDSHNRTPISRSECGQRKVSFDDEATVVIRYGKAEELHAASLPPWIETETEKFDVASAPTSSRAIKGGAAENHLYDSFQKVVVTPTSSNEDMVVEDSNTVVCHLHPSRSCHKKDKTFVSPRRISLLSGPSIWTASAPPLVPILKSNQSRWDATYSSTYKKFDESVPASNNHRFRQHHSSPLIMPQRSTSFHGSPTLLPPSPLLHLEKEEEGKIDSSPMVVEEDY